MCTTCGCGTGHTRINGQSIEPQQHSGKPLRFRSIDLGDQHHPTAPATAESPKKIDFGNRYRGDACTGNESGAHG